MPRALPVPRLRRVEVDPPPPRALRREELRAVEREVDRLRSSRDRSELTGADRESQEVSMLAMHLLQSALVLLNTLLVQKVIAEPYWAEWLTDADLRGLTPLFWSNINPYGTFFLDMARRLDLGLSIASDESAGLA